MDPPRRVDDPSLLGHDPLPTFITMLKAVKGQRSATKEAYSGFVKAMQQNDRAAAAAKRWACLLFEDVLSKDSVLEVTDGGEELYRVFLMYQYLLSEEGIDAAFRHQAHVCKCGIRIIKAIEVPGGALCAAQETAHRGTSVGGSHGRISSCPPRPKKACNQAAPGDHLSDTNLVPAAHLATDLSSAPGSQSRLGTPTIQRGVSTPATGAPSVLPKTAKLGKRSTFKKKRKASSQKPPVITPSDGSENDQEPSNTHAVTAASSISHRSKRIASDPCQPPGPIADGGHVDKTDSANRAETNQEVCQGTTSTSQAGPSLSSFQFDDFVSRPSLSDGGGAPLLLTGGQNHDEGRMFTVSAQPAKRHLKPGRPRKIKTVRDLQPRPSKRTCRASIPTLDGASGEGTGPAPAVLFQEPTHEGPPVIDPPSTRQNTHVEPKKRKKRNRLEFERIFVVPDKNASPESHEVLGPDDRQLRPLPKKIRHVRSAQLVRGVPEGAPSVEHADQLLRDIASNALVLLREGVGPELPDWTQDKEQDVEYDDLFGDSQDKSNDVQIPTSTSTPSKPPVPAPPRIWAGSRQEVCESFEYFRCYHSGVYSKDDIVKGYLLGAYSATRDIFHHDGKLIISHGGGKSESILLDARGGQRHQTDQDQEASDKSVRALLRTWKERRPIALLADDRYAVFPYDLASGGYTYVVLGLYWISHAWAECQSARDGSRRVVRWKFAFQWCEGQGDPWWQPQQMKNVGPDSPTTISNPRMCLTKVPSQAADTAEDPSIRCGNCQEESPFVYKQGWMCLNPHCDVFWRLDNGDPSQLDYREEFLSLLPQKFERLPNVTPVRAVVAHGGVTTTYACSKGWHCSKCGRLSCRYKWEHWECSNCKFTHTVNGRVRSPKEFWHQRPSKGFLHSLVGKQSGILMCHIEPIDLGRRRGFTNRLTFILPHGRGKIHLILGTPLSNGEADEIFRLYQQQASTGELKLRRYPLRNHRARGLLLTNYFSQNSGEPYQYVGGSGQTVPFPEAPECVRRALALIKERSSCALRTDIPFNEILSAAYMERQKMSFHSDSEKELGPTVASLSLGSAALMHFRPHLSAENPKAKCTYALTLVLRHGDVLIMDGDGVQKYYEHTVVPMNFRIAATARCIGST